MKIRPATLDDIPTLVELGRQFLAMTRFRIYDYNPKSNTLFDQKEDGSICSRMLLRSTGKSPEKCKWPLSVSAEKWLPTITSLVLRGLRDEK